jgi:hypothetical protein
MQNLFRAEQEYEKDLERMKDMYPREVEQIVALVSDRCDELEFEGSRLYDEYPDRMMMAREAQALYERLIREPGWSGMMTTQAQAAQPTVQRTPEQEQFALLPPDGWAVLEKADAGCESGCGGVLQAVWAPSAVSGGCDWLCCLVAILFQNEVYQRRCRYRRSKRWW